MECLHPKTAVLSDREIEWDALNPISRYIEDDHLPHMPRISDPSDGAE